VLKARDSATPDYQLRTMYKCRPNRGRLGLAEKRPGWSVRRPSLWSMRALISQVGPCGCPAVAFGRLLGRAIVGDDFWFEHRSRRRLQWTRGSRADGPVFADSRGIDRLGRGLPVLGEISSALLGALGIWAGDALNGEAASNCDRT